MLCVIGEEDVGLFVCDDVDVIAVVDVVVANQENEFYFWALELFLLCLFLQGSMPGWLGNGWDWKSGGTS